MWIYELNLRVGRIAPALFFLIGLQAGAQTTKEIVDKAYGLVLQKERTLATQVLVSGIKKSPQNKELLSALEEISSTFISDKAQQNYELGISMKGTDPSLAATKMNEAVKVEPDNVAILIELVRINIILNDCSLAEKLATKASEINPYSETLQLHLAQAAVCNGKYEQVDSLIPTDLRKSKYGPFWQLMQIDKLFKTGEFESALIQVKDLESKGAQKGPTDPEISYWRWKLEDQLKMKNEKSAQKYLTDCRKLSSRQARELGPDPQACRHTVEVENFLKKSHNTGL